MSNNITVEMVQDELTSISELYSERYAKNLAYDIHAIIQRNETIEDLNDMVHYILTIHEEEANGSVDEALYWIMRGYSSSVARSLALYYKEKSAKHIDDVETDYSTVINEFEPKEYRGALRVGDTVSYSQGMTEPKNWNPLTALRELWTVERYRIVDATDTQVAKQVLFLERHRMGANGVRHERAVVDYILSPEADNAVTPR